MTLALVRSEIDAATPKRRRPHSRAPFEPDALLTKREMARRLSISPRYLDKLNGLGKGPPRIAFGDQVVRYVWGDVVDWYETFREESRNGNPDRKR